MKGDYENDPINREGIAEYFPDIFNAFSGTADGRYFYLTNLENKFSYYSDEAVEYFGMSGNRIQGGSYTWLSRLSGEDRMEFFYDMNRLMAGETDEHDMIFRIRNKAGEYVTCSSRAKIIRDAEGNNKYLIGTITNHQKNQFIDQVTGLYNINYLFSKMKEFSKKGEGYHLLIAGVKDFFEINSSFGYAFGNKVLREIAEQWRTVSEEGMIYRTEGNKIVLLFRADSYDIDEIKEKFRSIANYFKEKMTINGDKVVIDIAGCILVSDNTNLDMNTVYSSALFVLDKVKKEKNSSLVVIDDKLFSGNKLFLEKLNYIRSCVLKDFRGFYLVYQPVVNSVTEKIEGMEALIRWNDEKYDNVPPHDFIEWLEKDTLFYRLGKWIVKNAIRDTGHILKDNPNFMLNINLAYPQLQNPNFKTDLERLIKEENFPGKNLRVELTERCKLIDKEALRDDLMFLKELGINVALDDLGTGYSALDLMVELPIDLIKIDRSLIINIEEDVSKQSLLRAITACAKELGKKVCVEGIETREMAKFVTENFYVTSIQGYYYSKPVKLEEIYKMLIKS